MKWFRKRELPVPTCAGWLLLTATAALLGLTAVRSAYPLLSDGAPLDNAALLIVEGWLPDDVLNEVFSRRGSTQRIVTTGGPVLFGNSLLEQKTYADVTAARLIQAGADASMILPVPAEEVSNDRTWASAVAVRRSLEQKGLRGTPCNLCTFGAHTRRSLYLYRRAFGPDWPVGAISMESDEFDLTRWWRSSLAFKHVVGEWISWVYTVWTPWKYSPPKGRSESSEPVQKR